MSALTAGVLLGGCGGADGGAGNSLTTGGVTISGIATDDPVANATVSLYSTGGALVTSTTTDASGSFAFSGVDLAALAQEYELVVTGGTLLGAPFTGEMRAIYGPQDNITQANVTLVTTLIARLTRDNQTTTTLIAKRDVAIQKMLSIGMLKAGEWNQTAPASVNLPSLRSRVRQSSIATWLNRLSVDLALNNLTAQNMDGFPRAHGGIFAIGLRNRLTLEAMQGDTIKAPINVSGDPTITYTYSLVSGPAGMQIDNLGNVNYTIPSGAIAASTIPFGIQATNPANGLSRNLKSSIYVMQTDVIVSGMIDVQGGRITAAWNNAYIDVPLNTTNGPTTITLIRGTQADGRYSYKIRSSQSLNNSVSVLLPDSRIRNLQLNQAVPASPPLRLRARVSTRARTPASGWKEITTNGFPVRARFITEGSDNRVSNNATILPFRLNSDITDKTAARLFRFDGNSTAPPTRCNTNNSSCIPPVLFIHGYTSNVASDSLGGGDGTWGQFPELLYNNSTAIPYEFDWATNARFNDAADDLAKALAFIERETGQKVHIIAHSFGGVLARTYLQGLGTNGITLPNHHVASLMTVGTPHSGIFKVATMVNGVSLPKGRDGIITGCRQLTCYQMGEKGYAAELRKNDVYFGINSIAGMLTAQLSDLATNPLPSDVPIRSLIGLTILNHFYEGGDKLISYAGQRFHPSLGNQPTDSNGASISVTLAGNLIQNQPQVTERILDIREIANANPTIPGAAMAVPGTWVDVTDSRILTPFLRNGNQMGYYHTTGANVIRGSVKEVNVESVDHDTYIAAKKWLQQNGPTPVASPPVISVTIRVFDGTTPQPYAPLANATVGIYTDPKSLVAEKYGVTDALGNFTTTVPFIANASYKAIVTNLSTDLSAESTITMQGTLRQSVRDFAAVTLMTNINTLIPPTSLQIGDLSGTITDALNGIVIAGVAYDIFNDASRSTRPIRSGFTDVSGLYNETGLVSGSYTIKLSKTSYDNVTIANFFVSGATSNVKNSGLSPVLTAGQMRIILNWGLNPTDLDSHLVKYNAASLPQYHIDFNNMVGTGGDNLNLDDTNSYGPETVTIQSIDPTARYVYAVHNYSNGNANGVGTTSITGGSNANVSVTGLPQPLNAPTTGAGPWWKVFEIVNGQVLPCTNGCMFTTQTAAMRSFTPQPNWLKVMQKGMTIK